MTSKEERQKNKERRKEIIAIARKYHLLKLLRPSKKQNEDSPDEGEDDINVSNLRLAFEELGPTFVKLGQILCTRPDLVGNEVAEELAKLRDNTPVTPFDEIRQENKEHNIKIYELEKQIKYLQEQIDDNNRYIEERTNELKEFCDKVNMKMKKVEDDESE